MAYDVLILNGSLIDGTGAAARPADLAVSGDRVARIGPPGSASEMAQLQFLRQMGRGWSR